MGPRLVFLVSALVAVFAGASVLSAQETSRWRSEAGSVLSIEETAGEVSIRYVEVQGTAAQVGITPGTVIFRGRRQGQVLTGTAFSFSANGCRHTYSMQITIQDDGNKLVTRADAPVRIDASCRILQTAARSFTWTRIGAPTAPASVAAPDDPRVAGLKFDCAYNPGIFGNPLAPPPIAIRAHGAISRWQDFIDKDEAQRFLSNVLSYARPHCQVERAQKAMRGQVYDVLHVTVGSPRGTVLDARYSDGRWNLSNNAPQWAESDRREEAARREREARLAEEARVAAEAAAARRRNREQFVSTYGVTQIVNTSTLRTNPFPFKDRVVGVYASFSQMLSEQDAMFDGLLVTAVPATEFTIAGAEVVLAVRVLGLKQMKLPMGIEAPLPQGTYLGAFKCKLSGCADFFER